MNDSRVDLLFLAWNRGVHPRDVHGAPDQHRLAVHPRAVRLRRRPEDGRASGWSTPSATSGAGPLSRPGWRAGRRDVGLPRRLERADPRKLDNDAMAPPGWLRQSLDVLDRHPSCHYLGIEALYPHVDDVDLPRSYTPARFIGGLGSYVARRSPTSPYAVQYLIRFGEWQSAQAPDWYWLDTPASRSSCSKPPLEPWRPTHSRTSSGVQRPWSGYDPLDALARRWPPNPSPRRPPRRPLLTQGARGAGGLMTYLGTRLPLRRRVPGRPSTVNNDPAHFDDASSGAFQQPQRKLGRLALADPIVAAPAGARDRVSAKIVDLDTEQQMVSDLGPAAAPADSQGRPAGTAASPWVADALPVLQQYAKLYPSCATSWTLRLHSVVQHGGRSSSYSAAVEDPKYMPVTPTVAARRASC